MIVPLSDVVSFLFVVTFGEYLTDWENILKMWLIAYYDYCTSFHAFLSTGFLLDGCFLKVLIGISDY